MVRIDPDVFSYQADLRAKADDANVLSKNLLDLLRFDGRYPPEAVLGAPVFKRAMYIPSTVYICMGSLQTGEDGNNELTHTQEIVVDGRHQGWVLTRGGLFRMERHLGSYK